MPNGNLTDRKFVSANSFSQNANGSLMVRILVMLINYIDDVAKSRSDAVSNVGEGAQGVGEDQNQIEEGHRTDDGI